VGETRTDTRLREQIAWAENQLILPGFGDFCAKVNGIVKRMPGSPRMNAQIGHELNHFEIIFKLEIPKDPY
jgi:hypothetical protein